VKLLSKYGIHCTKTGHVQLAHNIITAIKARHAKAKSDMISGSLPVSATIAGNYNTGEASSPQLVLISLVSPRPATTKRSLVEAGSFTTHTSPGRMGEEP
jgi:hypothetical protein